MMSSWERQVLGHVNNVVDIRIEGDWYLDILLTNLDLERRNLIGRLDGGEGQFITFFNVSNVIIKDKVNRRPGKTEWDRQECL